MSPEECIGALDNALEIAGETVILRRKAGAPAAQVNIDVTCMAFVRAYRLRDAELIAHTAVAQDEILVTISPTEIAAAQWPGGTLPPRPEMGDPSIPMRGDKVVVRGRERRIEVVDPVHVADVLVRIEMKATG